MRTGVIIFVAVSGLACGRSDALTEQLLQASQLKAFGGVRSNVGALTIGVLGEPAKDDFTASLRTVFTNGAPPVVVRPAVGGASAATQTQVGPAFSAGADLSDFDETTGYVRVGISRVDDLEPVQTALENAGVDANLLILEVETRITPAAAN